MSSILLTTFCGCQGPITAELEQERGRNGRNRLWKFTLVAPTDYVEARIRGDARLEPLPDGGIRVVSTRASNADQYVEWWVDESVIMPPGSQANKVLTIVCGNGSGDWWEVYGPWGSDEFEVEVTGPGSDGCWYFNESGRYTDFRVEIWLSGNSEITIRSIEFQVTFA